MQLLTYYVCSAARGGFWVIFMTLMVEPPITPWLTQKLGIAVPIKS